MGTSRFAFFRPPLISSFTLDLINANEPNWRAGRLEGRCGESGLPPKPREKSGSRPILPQIYLASDASAFTTGADLRVDGCVQSPPDLAEAETDPRNRPFSVRSGYTLT